MLKIGSVVLNVADVGRASQFWCAALGYVARGDSSQIVAPAISPTAETAEGLYLQLDETDRMHLDLHAASAEEQQAEVDRLISLGATKVEWTYPDDADFVVLADTEGNLFCVIDTSR